MWAAMLRVSRLRAGPGAGAYYLADLAEELALDELLVEGRAPGPRTPGMRAPGMQTPAARSPQGRADGPGRWLGPAPAALGLTGPVDPGSLAAVLGGCHPGTGRRLSLRPPAVAGYDLTFAAPKSASVLFGLGSPDVAAHVREAHDEAVEAAMGYVARHALAARRTEGEERWLVAVEGPVAASFPHGVSRALDPHLHTHVVVANLAHGTDGRWTAVDGRGLHAHAAAAGQVYDAHLRWRLHDDLGVTWTPRRSGAYEAELVDPAVLGAFSGRRAEILAEMGGRRSGRARAVAWAVTREEKGPRPGPLELRQKWWDRARAAALDPMALELGCGAELVRPPARRAPDELLPTGGPRHRAVDEHRFAGALCRTPHATATRRDVVAAWSGALATGAPADDIARCVEALGRWGSEVGVAEPVHALRGLVPGPHLLGMLGPRPAAPDRLGTWLGAAAAVERYRGRWAVRDAGDRPLGVDGSPGALARLPAGRLADHLAVERVIADAARRLGRVRGREPEVPELFLGR